MFFKRKIYFFLRYINSIYIFTIIKIKSFRSKSHFKKLFNSKYKKVHIICPGPSAKKVFNEEFHKDECIIFINHALKILPKIRTNDTMLYYFTSDGTRFQESINENLNQINKVTSIILTSHLYHFNYNLVKKSNLFFVPEITLSKEYGLIGKNKGPNSFSKISMKPFLTGFGSMINSLQLAILFKPKKIKLWGCDMIDVNNERYFSRDVPTRSTQQFDLTKEHFEIIKPIIEQTGIVFEK